MAERGAKPNVHPLRARVLKAISAFTSPLLPDDYLEMINPLWSTREVRGRVEELNREAGDATTVLIRPGHTWPGHEPGQYLRVGFDVDGIRHWRAYSITSDPGRADGFISITPKLVEEGKVSPYVNRELRPGTIVVLSDVEGQFVLPDPASREAAVHLGRQRDHADHGDAARSRSRGRARRRRPPALGADARRRDLRRPDARARRRQRRAAAAHPAHPRGRAAGSPPTASTSSAPTGASARRSSAARPRCSTTSSRCGRTPGSRTSSTWSASSRSSAATATGEGDGGTIKFLKSDVEARVRRSQPILDRRRGGRARARLRLPDGDLPHLRRQALLGAAARHAQR